MSTYNFKNMILWCYRIGIGILLGAGQILLCPDTWELEGYIGMSITISLYCIVTTILLPSIKSVSCRDNWFYLFLSVCVLYVLNRGIIFKVSKVIDWRIEPYPFIMLTLLSTPIYALYGALVTWAAYNFNKKFNQKQHKVTHVYVKEEIHEKYHIDFTSVKMWVYRVIVAVALSMYYFPSSLAIGVVMIIVNLGVCTLFLSSESKLPRFSVWLYMLIAIIIIHYIAMVVYQIAVYSTVDIFEADINRTLTMDDLYAFQIKELGISYVFLNTLMTLPSYIFYSIIAMAIIYIIASHNQQKNTDGKRMK